MGTQRSRIPKEWPNYGPQSITLELIRGLANAAYPDRIREIRDRDTKLILRHLPTGVLTLYANIARGKRERICDARRIVDTHSTWTLGKAKAEARRLKVQYDDGRDFASERKAERAIPTLSTYLTEVYGPWVKRNRRSGNATLARLESCFLDDFGATKISKLTPAMLEPWIAARQRGKLKAETIDRDVSALRAALGRAVKLELIDRNPLRGIETPEQDKHKRIVRALTATEKSALLETLTARDDKRREQRASANRWRKARRQDVLPPIGTYADALTPAVIASLETGLRRGELFGLDWSRVDFQEKAIRVEGSTAKTYETRDIPLNDAAYKALRDWWLQQGQPKGGLVFSLRGEPIGSLKRSYYAVLKGAGIERVNTRGERVNWHSLRHTFGTLLGAAGADPTTLMKLMGHANLATTQRYLHTDAERKRAAVELLQAHTPKE